MDNKRKEELEKKRAKLAELRRAREERQRPSSASGGDAVAAGGAGRLSPSTSSPATNAASPVAHRRDVDALVQSLVGLPAAVEAPPAAATTATASPARRQLQSSTTQTLCDVAPQQRIHYDKLVQTTGTTATDAADDDNNADKERAVQQQQQRQLLELRQRLAAEERDRIAAETAQAERQREEQHARAIEAARRSLLTVDEARSSTTAAAAGHTDLLSDQFAAFVDRSSKLVERAMDEQYDILKDYTRDADADRDDDARSAVKLNAVFFDERWSGGGRRCVTDLSWSQKFPELVLGAYSKSEGPDRMSSVSTSANEPEGVVLVWNMHLHTRCEFVFHAQSKVTAAQFSQFHPNLIVGGTYAGQVLLWDTRAKSAPVLSSPLSTTGHKHPVYSLAMVGTQQAHNLVTASTDGMVCTWQLDMLARPLEQLQLAHTAHPSSEEVSVTTFGFPGNESAAFWVGTLEGNVYQANRYDRAGNKAGVQANDTYVGHDGVVTGMHFHPINGAYDFSELLLTSSIDWTVKLWKIQPLSKPSVSPTTIKPLLSFDNANDYVNDVRWSPVHPGVFAAVDAAGCMDIWNLNRDTEAPVESIQVTAGTGTAVGLNKVAWDKTGAKCAAACRTGRIYVYDVGEMGTPSMDDFTHFQRGMQQLHADKLVGH